MKKFWKKVGEVMAKVGIFALGNADELIKIVQLIEEQKQKK